MKHTGAGANSAIDLTSLIHTKEARIEELKCRLRGDISFDEEMNLLINLSRELRELFYIKEKSYSDFVCE